MYGEAKVRSREARLSGKASTRATPATPLPDAHSMRWKVTPLGLLCFVCGAFYLLKVNLVGEIFVAELLLIVAGLAAALSRGSRALFKNSVFLALLAASILSLAGYMVSDFVRGTDEAQYMRGWARTVFIILNFLALSLLIAADRRNLWWFAAGIAVGSIVYLKFGLRLPVNAMHYWKFMYAMPVTMLVACLAAFLPLKIVSIAFAALGAFSMFTDYRIHGAVCVLIAGLMWAAGSARLQRLQVVDLAKVAVLGAVALGGALFVLSLSENEWTEQRRDASDFTREVGVRFGLHAISASPIIGYGSWANNAELVRISDEEIRAHEQRTGTRWSEGYGKAFVSHSQILQAWLEGGVLGASLYLLLGFLILRETALAILRRRGDLLTPLVLFLLMFQFWHLLASPLGSSVRIHFSLAMALVAMLYAERKATGGTMYPITRKLQQVRKAYRLNPNASSR